MRRITDIQDENVYKSALDSMEHGLLLCDTKGFICFANNYLLKLSGYKSEELIGSHADKLISEIEAGSIQTQFDQMKTKNIIETIAMLQVHSDKKIPIDISFKPITPERILLELHHSAFSGLEDVSIQSILGYEDILLIFDAKTGVIYKCNQTLAKRFGKPLDSIIGKKLGDFLPEQAQAQLFKQSRKAAREQHIQIFEDERLGKSFHHIVIPLNQSNPNIVIAISIDLTKQKDIMKRSSQHEVQLDLIMKYLPVTAYTTVIDKDIESIQIHADNFLGNKTEEFKNDTAKWMSLIHPDDIDAVLENMEKTLEGIITDDDFRFRDSEGNYHWMLNRGRAKSTDNGKKVIYGALIDVTDRKNIESRLKETLKEKDILMKEINHRVKNNLLMISSIISLKEAESGDDLSDISRQIDAIRIVHEKLYQSENITEINLSEYTNDLIHTISGSFFDYPLSFHNEIPDIMIPTKKIIPLGLIINELATNAIKHGFTPGSRSEIAMSLKKKDDDCYILTFSNSGKPIPDDIDMNNPKTLGLRLLQALMSQVSGYLEVIRSPHPVFNITFKIN